MIQCYISIPLITSLPMAALAAMGEGASYVYVLFFVNLTGYALGVGGTTSLAQHAFLEDWAPVGGP